MKLSVDGNRCFILTRRRGEEKTVELKEGHKGSLKAHRQVDFVDLLKENRAAGS